MVVVSGEVVEQRLEVVDRRGGGSSGEPFLEGLLEAFDLAAGGRVVGAGVFLGDAEFVE